MKARLFMSAKAGGDMDVFVAVWKLDANGDPVYFPIHALHDDGPITLGWIRASHRELDKARSTDVRPVLAHREGRAVAPGEVVGLEIEIWPPGTHFDAGEKLLPLVQGTDVNKYSNEVLYPRHERSVNRSLHEVHTGGRYASYLQVPSVTPLESSDAGGEAASKGIVMRRATARGAPS